MTAKNRFASAGPKRRRAFALALALALPLVLGAGQALAKNGTDTGGYTGPGPDLVTVAQARDMGDDARVALKGNIVQSLGGEDYVFKDATGTITIEIDGKRWQGRSIGPEDLVEIHGEVDKGWSEEKIEVKRIIKR